MFNVSINFLRPARICQSIGLAAFVIIIGAFSLVEGSSANAGVPQNPKPTIVLVHGAFAESASWNAVATQLSKRGYRVVAAANPLRSVRADANYVASVIRSIDGRVVLVGHSYGGSVISSAAVGNPQVKALVYVAAFAPSQGESALELSNRFKGSTLGSALDKPIKLPEGGNELSIRQERFRDQFAADVPVVDAARMAVTQRPIAEAALGEASGEPAWRGVPSWFIFGTADKNIPAEALRFMADRAGSKKTVAIEGASHVVMVSHPQAVAQLIMKAATETIDRP